MLLTQASTVATDSLSRLERAAEVAAIAQAWMTVAGIAVAGLWTYLIFVRQRQRFPRASVQHTLLHRTLADGSQLVTVCARLTNIGQGLISIANASVVVQRVAPLSRSLEEQALAAHNPQTSDRRREVLWYRIGYWSTGFTPAIEVEPGETEDILFDFRFSKHERAIKVNTHIENEMKRTSPSRFSKWVPASIRRPQRWIGWQCTSYHNLDDSAPVLRVVPQLSAENTDAAGS
jgi:hypothetical protein